MRSAFGLALVAALLWMPAGCRRGRKAATVAPAEDGGPRIASTVSVGDPKSAGQLIQGFYDIEEHAWRWTAKQFTVELGTPRGAAQRGGMLTLQFTIPPSSIEKLHSIQITASVDGNLLPPENYTQAGSYSFERSVPAALLGKDSVRVTFDLDKAIPGGAVDARELGVVANSVGLKVQ